MAILESDGLAFEFRYAGMHRMNGAWDEVSFEYGLLWKGESMFNEKTMGSGRFSGDSDDDYHLIHLLDHVLATGKADYWNDIGEPQHCVAIYPDDWFPFLPNRLKIVRIDNAYQAELDARERLKAEKGQLPDDHFTVIVHVDTYQFDKSEGYTTQGPALILNVYRHQLAAFRAELETEYAALRKIE
jgi:hypothetical protein